MAPRLYPLIAIAFALAPLGARAGELTVYYLRHAQGGHNVVDEYQRKGIPRSEWPAWVGDQNVFTPVGVTQALALAESLRPFTFDLIAVSGLWRTRNTILPYLRATGRVAEIWPELTESSMGGDSSDEAFRQVDPAFLAGGQTVKLPAEEQAFFRPRPGECGLRMLVATNAAQAGALARRVEALLAERFGTNDARVLLVGHGTAGMTLIRRLTRTPQPAPRILGNTQLWRARRAGEAPWALDYHGLMAPDAARREPQPAAASP